MKRLSRYIIILILGVLVICGALIFSGNTHVITAVKKTYLSGQGGPGIYDLDKFPKRLIRTGNTRSWARSEQFGQLTLSENQAETHQKFKTSAFLVSKDSKILFEQYWDEHKQGTLSNSFSMAKSLIAILIYQADSMGYLSIEDPVFKHLPEFKGEGRERVRLSHLMSMGSGLRWSESGGNPFSDNARAYYGKDLASLVMSMTPEEEPGLHFVYKSGNTELLALVLERATGMKLAEFASKHFWSRLGAEENAYWSLDRESGHEKAYCCWYAIGRDFLRIGQLLLDSGRIEGKQIIPTKYFHDAYQAAPLALPEGGINSRYSKASLWLLPHKGRVYPYLRGILGQYIVLLPEEKAVMVRLGHKRGEVDEAGHPGDVYKFVQIAQELLENEKRH